MPTLSSFIPIPLSEINFCFQRTRSVLQKKTPDDNNAALRVSSILAKKILRITLAAAAAFTVLKIGCSLIVAGTVGALISLPATLIALGSYGLYVGLAGVITAVATKSLAALAISLITAAAGWITLQNYNCSYLGLAENYLLNPAANFLAPAVRSAIKITA